MFRGLELRTLEFDLCFHSDECPGACAGLFRDPLVKFDEVFVKLKEISNPGHPRFRASVGAGGRGWE